MLNTSFWKSLRIAQRAVVVGLCLSSMVLLAQGPGLGIGAGVAGGAGPGAQANAPGSGRQRAQELERVLRQQNGNGPQQDARDRVVEAARRAGQENPDDPSAVDKAVEKVLDDERVRAEGGPNRRGNRNNGLRNWIMRLKAFLMDIGLLEATDAAREGEAKAERLAERIGAEVTSNDDQESAAKKIADAAKEAGRLFPDDENKVVDAVNKALKKVKAETTQGETKTWISALAEGLRRGRYGAFDLISITPEPTTAPAGSRVVMTGVVVAGEPRDGDGGRSGRGRTGRYGDRGCRGREGNGREGPRALHRSGRDRDGRGDLAGRVEVAALHRDGPAVAAAEPGFGRRLHASCARQQCEAGHRTSTARLG